MQNPDILMNRTDPKGAIETIINGIVVINEK